jgi:orotate phosphoribosyltransferase
MTIVDRGEDSSQVFEAVGVSFMALVHVSELGV